MQTEFGREEQKKAVPLSEYPRPQLSRDSYLCLNGEWDFEIAPIGMEIDGYTEKIRVPFCPESEASGLGVQILPMDIMHYRKQFSLPSGFASDLVKLHFGGVDYSCEVRVNGKLVCEHAGGYLPFFVDITDVLEEQNVVELKVWDPTDQGWGQRGKQVLKPSTIWYTATSGIYQTVWLESVPKIHVEDLAISQDFQKKQVSLAISCGKYQSGEVAISFEGREVAKKILNGEKIVTLEIKDAKDWSPQQPNLYQINLQVEQDKVESYFGFREFSTKIAKDGKKRLYLNGEPYLHNGLLDQGYWPESLLTPPSEEAMIFDIEKTKKAGFNMLRKHIKIEPLRWYYLCDKLGMLVWQDFVSGGSKYNPFVTMVLPFCNIKLKDENHKLFARESEEGRAEFLRDAIGTMDLLKNVCSISTWVVFNEGWGQFDSKNISEIVRKKDSTRHVDSTSGWHDTNSGDFSSKHIYFSKLKFKKSDRVIALSEFGGYSMAVEEHYYSRKKPFGYRLYKSQKQLEKAYAELFQNATNQLENGLSALVYTQVSDVETECNGLFSYDRAVQKISTEVLQKSNQELYSKFDELTK